jgi:hypothetical protein
MWIVRDYLGRFVDDGNRNNLPVEFNFAPWRFSGRALSLVSRCDGLGGSDRQFDCGCRVESLDPKAGIRVQLREQIGDFIRSADHHAAFLADARDKGFQPLLALLNGQGCSGPAQFCSRNR